ncbi:MAG: (2Fe-2S) ferredoxin domain-containing protein [Anaerolineae bacterium]|nr:(2Fe-2S) ferredoxin domain-containing protein [Anaerolineae bacterium]
MRITICVGSSCTVRGADDLAAALESLIQEAGLGGEVELAGSFCMGACSMGVSLQVGEDLYREVQPEEVEAFFRQVILPRVRGRMP